MYILSYIKIKLFNGVIISPLLQIIHNTIIFELKTVNILKRVDEIQIKDKENSLRIIQIIPLLFTFFSYLAIFL